MRHLPLIRTNPTALPEALELVALANAWENDNDDVGNPALGLVLGVQSLLFAVHLFTNDTMALLPLTAKFPVRIHLTEASNSAFISFVHEGEPDCKDSACAAPAIWNIVEYIITHAPCSSVIV
jgi:hypothetical protein